MARGGKSRQPCETGGNRKEQPALVRGRAAQIPCADTIGSKASCAQAREARLRDQS